jgi:hypothetical protein
MGAHPPGSCYPSCQYLEIENKRLRGQSRRQSLLETCMSTAIGYVVAVSAQIVVFPWFGIHVKPEANIMIGGVFTVVSVVRGFFVRRLFNHLHVKGVL